MVRFEDIIEKIDSYNPSANIDLIKRAYIYSAKVHGGQVRHSGEPYLSHPLEVANIIVDLKLDEVAVAAGLLHDTLEDTLATVEALNRDFGQEVTNLVDGVTKISKISFNSAEERQAENYRKMILAMAKDIRVIIIKLADRLHNMRTLQYLSSDKQARIAQETIDIYAPFANRLGIAKIKWELEDLSLKFLHKDIYNDIETRMKEKEKERLELIEKLTKTIDNKLNEAGIKNQIYGRLKHFCSIYLKMVRKGVSFDEVLDLVALRVITESVKDCYGALGIIHTLWAPIPGEFDDYIATPKPNMYQSLHTAVIGPNGQPLEIQIRTQEMHRTAEEGIAAHWLYKEKDSQALVKDFDKKFVWLKQLMEWQQDLKDPKEFLHTVKTDLFPDEVYVFTPKSDVKALPRGGTCLDFAFAVHTDIGCKCIGAKVNGKMVPLKYQFKNGDIVEICTSAHQSPHRDWLKMVKTSKAIHQIRHALKIQERNKSIKLGEELLAQEFNKYHLTLAKVIKSGELDRIAKQRGFAKSEELFASIGYGKITSEKVVNQIVSPEKVKEKKDLIKKGKTKGKEQGIPKEGGIIIEGIDDILVRFAKCCNPIKGDEIVGFITRGRGVTVHTISCPNITRFGYDLERNVAVSWDMKKVLIQNIGLTVVAQDKPGLLANISAAIFATSTNIATAEMKTTPNKKLLINFILNINNVEQLKKIILSIKKIKGVISVERKNKG
ncbi:MAG: bifunctional (p)ppGpp synthetase/guanosine-3',5'-bis(diphosphate) 3'-pyrophosphohydrolase [bacterium]